jgi:hypothetical protein
MSAQFKFLVEVADKKDESLAYAEIFHVAAAMFRRFEFELHETDFSNLELKHDFFLPVPKLDSKGVRVKVTSVAS